MGRTKSPESAITFVRGMPIPWSILFILHSLLAYQHFGKAAASDASADSLNLLQRSATTVGESPEQANVVRDVGTVLQQREDSHGSSKKSKVAKSSSRFAVNGNTKTNGSQIFPFAGLHTQVATYRSKHVRRATADDTSTRDRASPPRRSHAMWEKIGTAKALLRLAAVMATIVAAIAIVRPQSHCKASACDLCATETTGNGVEYLADGESQFGFTSLDDYSKAGQELFHPSFTQGRALPVLVCAYNEEAVDVLLTLRSLLEQQTALQSSQKSQTGGWSLKVMVALDGWYRASNSLQEFVKSVCPAKTHGDWAAVLEAEDVGPKAVAVNGRIRHPQNLCGLAGELDVTFCIKTSNQRKHDSVAMFLCGFAPLFAAEYAFITDTGSSFADGCLRKLLEFMAERPACAGVTGHVRVMQDGPWETQTYSGIHAGFLHAYQTAEQELSVNYFYFSSLIGFMPCLHGPCNLWRLPLLSKDNLHREVAQPSAIDIFNKAMADCKGTGNMIDANTLLNEDRYLSFSAMLCSGDLHFVPDAVFYYQAESDWATFFAQRRRWNNGTLACYIRMLQAVIHGHGHRSWVFNMGVCFFCASQILSMFVFGALAPGFLFHAFIGSAGVVMVIVPPASFIAECCQWCLESEAYVGAWFLCLLALAMFTHHSAGEPRIWILVVLTYFAYFVSICCAAGGLSVAICSHMDCPAIPRSSGIVVALTVLGVLDKMSFAIHSLLHGDMRSICLVVLRLPQYLLNDAVKGWHLSCHMGMLHCLKWGNRPDSTEDSPDMRWQSGIVMVVVWSANAVIIVARDQLTSSIVNGCLALNLPLILLPLLTIPVRVLLVMKRGYSVC